jgi:hypothetical protein
MTPDMDVRYVVKLAREAKLPKYMFDTNDGRLALMRFVALVVARTQASPNAAVERSSIGK